MRYLLAFLLSCAPAMAFAAADTYAQGTEKDGGLPQFNLETYPSQAFWLFVTFFFVYAFVKNIVLPQIDGTMTLREDHIRHELQEAGALNEKARILQDDYEKRMKEAHNEAHDKSMEARTIIAKKLSEAEAKQREAFTNKRNAFIGSYKAQRIKIKEELAVEAKTLSKIVAEKLTNSAPLKKQKAA